jgi:hypothetical protein
MRVLYYEGTRRPKCPFSMVEKNKKTVLYLGSSWYDKLKQERYTETIAPGPQFLVGHDQSINAERNDGHDQDHPKLVLREAGCSGCRAIHPLWQECPGLNFPAFL